MRRFRRIVACLMICTGLVACRGSLYYTADPIEAWVVDAETGKPIEGAIVTANWQLVAFSFDSARKLRQLEVKETATDAKGRFYFPGFTKLNASMEELREEDPQILIFKSGYRYLRASSNYPIGKEYPGPHRLSPVAGQTLRLEKADSDARKYAFHLDALTSSLMNITEAGDAARIRLMLGALACERLRLKRIDEGVVLSIPGAPHGGGECDAK